MRNLFLPKAAIILLAVSFHFSTLFAQPGAGNSGTFNGTNSYINVGNVVANNVRTVEMWFKPNAVISSSTIGPGKALIGRDYSNGSGLSIDEYALVFPDFQPRAKLFFFRRIGQTSHGVSSNDNYWEAGIWYHVAAVIYPEDGMRLYINGVMQTDTDTSTAPIQPRSNVTWDNTNIGRLGEYVLGSMIRYFNGEIDEVRMWTTARSEEEIREYMCQTLQGTEPGLHAYWNFDESSGTTLKDQSNNSYDGTAMGTGASTSRALSSAPLGDTSVYIYDNQMGFPGWNMASLGLAGKSSDSLVVDGISSTANPDGAHIYYIDSLPNLDGGLSQCVQESHYGVFMAHDNDTSFVYDATYFYGLNNGFISSSNESSAVLFRRKNHADSTWVNSNASLDTSLNHLSLSGESYRNEYILSTNLIVDLGPDLSLCEGSSIILRPTQQGGTFLWQDGSAADSLLVTQGGLFWVEINNGPGCMGRDSVNITSLLFPAATFMNVQMGNQVQFNSTYPVAPGVTYKWFFGDGDSSNIHNPLHTYSAPGTYNVMHIVSNICGADTTVKKVNFSGSDAIDHHLLEALSIYPNPTSGWIHISGVPLKGWKLYELQGRLLKSASWAGSDDHVEINLSGLSKGIYFLKVDDGTRQAVIRIVLQ